MGFTSSAASQTFPSAQSAAIRKLTAVVVGSGLVAACSYVAVPLYFTPVPLTLQTFAVLLLALLFGPSIAVTALALYLFEGVAGLPVFSPYGPAGVLRIMGPTGGYLLAWPFAAALVGYLYPRLRKLGTRYAGITSSLLSGTAGALLILGCGSLWLAVASHLTTRAVFSTAVLPFLPGEALKIVAAAAIAAGVRRYRTARG